MTDDELLDRLDELFAEPPVRRFDDLLRCMDSALLEALDDLEGSS